MTKSSTTVNLAAALAETRRGTVVDLDEQQRDSMRFEGAIDGVFWCEGIPLIAAENEFTLVDTPPKFGDATGDAYKRSNLILIPCTPHAASLESLARTFETVNLYWQQNNDLKALVVFTCVDRSQYAQGVMAAARVLSAWPVAQTTIPARVMDFERSYTVRRPVVLNAPKSAGAVAYRALAREIEQLLGSE